ncbi:DUF2029 domain-containing protein [Frankia sp. AiPs1]
MDPSACLPGSSRPPLAGRSGTVAPPADGPATARSAPGSERRAGARLWAAWLVTRALLTVLVLTGQTFGAQQNVQGDLRIYAGWAHALGHGGGLPVGDDRWQYPPAAAVAFVLPEFVHTLSMLSYRVAFVGLALIVDGMVTVALNRRTRAAAMFWVAGITALGPVVLARFDLLPAAAAMGTVLAMARGRPGRAGFHLGVGVLLKVWPVLLLVAVPRPARGPGAGGTGRSMPEAAGRGAAGSWSWAGPRRLVGGMLGAATVLGVVLAASGWWRDAFGFVGAQQARGLQVEAVAATPFVLAHMAGGPGPRYSYGSLQFDGPLARAVATACSLAEAAVIILAVAWWWLWTVRRPQGAPTPGATAATLAERGLALVLVVVVTARVLSPQYLVWLLALVAASLAVGPAADGPGTRPWGSGRPAGRLATALVAVALVSQVIYPWRYNDVVQGRIVLSVLLVARNLGMIMMCWWALRAAAEPTPLPGRRPPGPAA